MEKISNRPDLPEIDRFKRQFEEKYGRRMKPDEIRVFQLIEKLLMNPPEEGKEVGAEE
ncbi:MAG TPA: hypothetical protein VFB28_04345 [Terriglobales bacterium]|nr:hypothetical protein [Terriglobales bacterium]